MSHSSFFLFVAAFQSTSHDIKVKMRDSRSLFKRFLEPGYSSGSLMPLLRHYLSTVRVEWLKRCALFITNSQSFATLDHRQWWSIVWTAVSDEGSRTLSDLIYRHFCRCTLREGALNLKLLPFYFFFHLNPYFLISLRESWCGILNCISYFDRPRCRYTLRCIKRRIYIYIYRLSRKTLLPSVVISVAFTHVLQSTFP